MGGRGFNSCESGQKQLVRFCEYGNEPSGPVNCVEFRDQPRNRQILKKDLRHRDQKDAPFFLILFQ